MKKTLLVLSITLLGTLLGSNVMGQNNAQTQPVILGMPEVSLLSVVETTPVNLTLTTSTAGLAVESSKSVATTKLLISSVIKETLRTVSAKVSSVPNGTYLTLQAKAPTSGQQGGTMAATADGYPLATLSTTDAPIITGIGSCYSGITTGDGYILEYTWGLLDTQTNYANVRATVATNSVTVTLTLSAAN